MPNIFFRFSSPLAHMKYKQIKKIVVEGFCIFAKKNKLVFIWTLNIFDNLILWY